MGTEVHKQWAMIQEECSLVAVMDTPADGCDSGFMMKMQVSQPVKPVLSLHS